MIFLGDINYKIEANLAGRYENLLDAVGNTPIVKLNKITKGLKARIWVKLEMANPGGSIKDRISRYMIEKAEKDGRIKPGDTIIENSSGNTAMGLAIAARQKGYKLKVVLRNTISTEKLKMLEIMGVDVILVDASLPPEDEKSYNNFAKYLADRNPDFYYIDQHNNLDNNEAHYMSTGPEIWEQMEGKVDYLIGAIGTCGTILGAGKYLKEKNSQIKVIGLDPYGSVFYDYFKSGEMIKPFRYYTEGAGDEFIIGTAKLHELDDIMKFDDKSAFMWARRAACEEGILAGGSSGANIYGAVELAKQIDREADIVTFIPDSGYKYLSSVYNDEWLKQRGLL